MDSAKNEIVEQGLRDLSTEGLAMLGTDQIAYIRPQQVKGQTIYVVHGANGKELAGFDNQVSALAACHEHELEAMALN
ncbi:MAG: hypothetical protein HOA08_06080 [Rhodospirillaceae bacterium]|jgi:hypothetical protein|nr:hypothetical protein [Rhodospirillaceae bacterium]MBT3491161.1 hypothetical protein [Rhodospirillaceae bacterium]MBT3781216.1 hypothetical protein [Rhodospirillaceae bacterium]MBT3979464.1 hypothetical protein [Rhodospirillaceae bacterium]MBT4168065.1 hypothetical protein [Rhodospirillaceae bacterium]